MIKHLTTLKGYRPLCFADKNIIASKKNFLYLFNPESLKFKRVFQFEFQLKQKIGSLNRILSRIFRIGPNNCICQSEGSIHISMDGCLMEINIKNYDIKNIHRFRAGMRNPLSLALIDNISNFDASVCYGEYFYNPNKKSVHIWKKKHDEDKFKIAYTFKQGIIEHIHAIIPDIIRNVVWILTGDFGKSAGIWVAENNFREVTPVAIGKQFYRACVAFPVSEGILYATDSQLESNSIRLLRYDKKKWTSEIIYHLDGPCIYGCKVNNQFIFSTSVEPGFSKNAFIIDLFDRKPGPGVKKNASQLVIGNLDNGFKTITHWEKDIWPMRLGQFGTIIFPHGKNPTNSLFLYSIGLKNHDNLMEIYDFNTAPRSSLRTIEG